jgi:uncharacterized protein GlcG (DUF336 family)
MITLEQAKKAVAAAQAKAKELNIAVTTVITDEHGSIILVEKMDGSLQISPQFAYAKSFTSANLGFPTSALAQFAGEKKPYFGINSLFGGEFTTIAGGVPVVKDDKRIGGIGVGGSTDVSEDEQCANAALEAITG